MRCAAQFFFSSAQTVLNEEVYFVKIICVIRNIQLMPLHGMIETLIFKMFLIEGSQNDIKFLRFKLFFASFFNLLPIHPIVLLNLRTACDACKK